MALPLQTIADGMALTASTAQGLSGEGCNKGNTVVVALEDDDDDDGCACAISLLQAPLDTFVVAILEILCVCVLLDVCFVNSVRYGCVGAFLPLSRLRTLLSRLGRVCGILLSHWKCLRRLQDNSRATQQQLQDATGEVSHAQSEMSSCARCCVRMGYFEVALAVSFRRIYLSGLFHGSLMIDSFYRSRGTYSTVSFRSFKRTVPYSFTCR